MPGTHTDRRTASRRAGQMLAVLAALALIAVLMLEHRRLAVLSAWTSSAPGGCSTGPGSYTRPPSRTPGCVPETTGVVPAVYLALRSGLLHEVAAAGPLDDVGASTAARNCIRLSFSLLPPADLQTAAARLGVALQR